MMTHTQILNPLNTLRPSLNILVNINPLTNTSPTNSNLSSSHFITSNIKNLINITSLNIQGNDTTLKLLSISMSLKSRSIFCCNETKQSALKPFPKRIHNNLMISSLPDLTSKNGTCILIGSHLTSHIHKHYSINPYWCSIYLKFKPKIDLLIISLYLPHDISEHKIATHSLNLFL